jgi:hypothetical protein
LRKEKQGVIPAQAGIQVLPTADRNQRNDQPCWFPACAEMNFLASFAQPLRLRAFAVKKGFFRASLEVAPHAPVQDAGVEKFLAFCAKPVALVKRHGMELCIQLNAR